MAADYSGEIYVAIEGDSNLDGRVNVLGDGFALVAGLGISENATWRDGDLDADNDVDILGDAFRLVANLGQSVIPPAASSKTPSTIQPISDFDSNSLIVIAEPQFSGLPTEFLTLILKGEQQAVSESDDRNRELNVAVVDSRESESLVSASASLAVDASRYDSLDEMLEAVELWSSVSLDDADFDDRFDFDLGTPP